MYDNPVPINRLTDTKKYISFNATKCYICKLPPSSLDYKDRDY